MSKSRFQNEAVHCSNSAVALVILGQFHAFFGQSTVGEDVKCGALGIGLLPTSKPGLLFAALQICRKRFLVSSYERRTARPSLESHD
jgi:hypothetical protein